MGRWGREDEEGMRRLKNDWKEILNNIRTIQVSSPHGHNSKQHILYINETIAHFPLRIDFVRDYWIGTNTRTLWIHIRFFSSCLPPHTFEAGSDCKHKLPDLCWYLHPVQLAFPVQALPLTIPRTQLKDTVSLYQLLDGTIVVSKQLWVLSYMLLFLSLIIYC